MFTCRELGDNHLTSVPGEIGQLISLFYLYGSVVPAFLLNPLLRPPAASHALGSRYRGLSNMQLTSFPAEIWRLTGLTTLYGGVAAVCLPLLPPVRALTRTLCTPAGRDLSDNRLTSVPAEIGQLLNLAELYENVVAACLACSTPPLPHTHCVSGYRGLSENRLSSVPVEVGQLTSLTVLYGSIAAARLLVATPSVPLAD